MPGRRVVACLDLPEAGDAGTHVVTGPQLAVEELDLFGQRRARTDEAHVTLEHVDQLRDLVDARALEDPAHSLSGAGRRRA